VTSIRSLLTRLERVEAARPALTPLARLSNAELRDMALEHANDLDANGRREAAEAERDFVGETYAELERFEALLRGEPMPDTGRESL
jgi:hypothetical protein